jgi:hypothetical protein
MSAAAQHPGDTEVLVELGPVNAHRHQPKVSARCCAGIAEPWVPRKRGCNLPAIRQRHHEFVGGEATETGLISPTSISKVLLPFAFEEIALRSQVTDNSAYSWAGNPALTATDRSCSQNLAS